MQIVTGIVTDTPTSENTLVAATVAFPNINKHMIRFQADSQQIWLVNYTMGHGAILTDPSKLPNGGGTTHRNYMSWYRMGPARRALHVTALPTGNGLNNANITFQFAENWLSIGLVLLFQDGQGGGTNIVITGGPTPNAGNFDYTGKIVGSATATFNPALAQVGQTVAWSGGAVAACGSVVSTIPVVYPDEFTNYTTKFSMGQQVCDTGIMTKTWIEFENGERCWLYEQDFQARNQLLKSFESQGWWGTTTMATGTSNLTDATGNPIVTGSGVFEQLQTSYTVTYNIAAAYNPATQAVFLASFRNSIENWAIDNAITADKINLNCVCGTKGFSLLQQVLQAYAVQLGERVVIDYQNAADKEIISGTNVNMYRFAGFTITLIKNCAWDDEGTNGATYLTTTIPQASFTLMVMPETLTDGQPPIQVYFRDGNGVEAGWVARYIPGTVNPLDPGAMGMANTVNSQDGFNVYYKSEYMFIVPDPAKILRWSGV